MQDLSPQEIQDVSLGLSKAREAFQKAYAPYSHFHVGACLKLSSRRYISACNVENASYGASLCAERNALAQMIALFGVEKPLWLLVYAGPLVTPCGLCRQSLLEFCSPSMPLYLFGENTTQGKKVLLQDLVPYPFGASDLQKT